MPRFLRSTVGSFDVLELLYLQRDILPEIEAFQFACLHTLSGLKARLVFRLVAMGIYKLLRDAPAIEFADYQSNPPRSGTVGFVRC